MASRAVPQQARGEAVAKQKNGGAEGRNRRALNDIGNLVPNIPGVDGKPLPSRPVTRSFCAQLLANAQAVAENNKAKPNALNAGGGPILVDAVTKPKVGRGGLGKAVVAQKKVPIKPPPQKVIDISSDTDEDEKKEKSANKKKVGEASRKKKAPSLTSVLTARSKAVCEKPKVRIDDIDAGDLSNELAVVEYVEDMYTFYKEVESESQVHDYMGSQPEINEKMRAILVDWIIEVHNKFELTKETLYLTINIVDRFLSATMVPRRELQLLGIGAMLMASKYEEIWAPEVNDFVCISDRAYTHQQILIMEKAILGKLEWTLTVPTPYVFLVRFIKAALSDQEKENMVHSSAEQGIVNHDKSKHCGTVQMENMVYFFAELGMVNYDTIKYCPSMIAASAVYAARCTLSCSPLWNDTLKLHTGFSEQQLMDCARLLVGFHSKAAENKLKVVYRKYSNPERLAVALLPPAKALLAATSSSS